MTRILAVFSLLSAFTVTGSLFAEEPSNVTATASSVPAVAPSRVARSALGEDIPRDPAGVRGISPFWERVFQGDAEYLAQDFVAARSSYQSAITQDPKNPVGHLRMAELNMNQGKLDEAQSFAESALRFSNENLRQKARASFLVAEIRERQKLSDEAIVDWRAYKSLGAQIPPHNPVQGKGPADVKIYAESADSRVSALETVKKLDADCVQVRERIKKGLDEAELATTGTSEPAPAK